MVLTSCLGGCQRLPCQLLKDWHAHTACNAPNLQHRHCPARQKLQLVSCRGLNSPAAWRRCAADPSTSMAEADMAAAEHSKNPHPVKRRGLLAAALVAHLYFPLVASAAIGATGGSSGGLVGSLFDLLPPQTPDPVRFPRKALDQKFAVLLMRTTYEAVDSLDFVPMDQFQVDFWKLRQGEYEPYLLQLDPLKVRQGDLQDPLYFDFISFAQYATVSREIPKARQVFQEYCSECEGSTRVVSRAPELQDNGLLPTALQYRIGDMLYASLRTGFEGVQFDAPEPCPPSAGMPELAAAVQQLLDIFVRKGYAIKAQVQNVTSNPPGGAALGSFQVTLDGPANLWGLAALASRRSLLANTYDAMAVEAFLRASGRTGAYSVARTDTAVTERWVVM